MGNKKQKQKVVLPPTLPPDVPEDDIEFSDEDLDFVKSNCDYAGFVSNLDTQSITRHINRVADVKEDAVELLYEKRVRKRSLADDNDNIVQHEVHPEYGLPVKMLDGEVYFKTEKGTSKFAINEEETIGENEDVGRDNGIVKLTKAEKREKIKKERNEAKKHGKEVTGEEEEVQQTSQAEVLALSQITTRGQIPYVLLMVLTPVHQLRVTVSVYHN